MIFHAGANVFFTLYCPVKSLPRLTGALCRIGGLNVFMLLIRRWKIKDAASIWCREDVRLGRSVCINECIFLGAFTRLVASNFEVQTVNRELRWSMPLCHPHDMKL